MNRQEAFDRAVLALAARGWTQSYNALLNTCLYAGIGCALGVLIDDRALAERLDNRGNCSAMETGVRAILGGIDADALALGAILGPLAADVDFLEDMQRAHDSAPEVPDAEGAELEAAVPAIIEANFRELATTYGLRWPVKG